MLYPELETKLRQARYDLNRATSENIVVLCQQYLALLAEYRNQLYENKNTFRVGPQPADAPSPECFDDAKKAVRAAIEKTTQERNRTELLLLSFTTVSAYEAVEIFNRRKYEGHDDWELRASGVKFHGGTGQDLMTIQEAVELAGLLRREEQIAHNTGRTLEARQASP